MKIQTVNPIQQNMTEKHAEPKFRGGADSFLRYLATNQAVGANGVDLCFMVAPRTANDGIKRGPAAGMETGRREIMGTINDSLVGVFGAASGAAIAFTVNNKYGTNINRMFTAPETLNILAENKANQIKNNKSQIDYIKTTLKSVRAYNPTAKNSDNEGYVKLSNKTVNKIAEYYDELFKNKSGFNHWTKNKSDKSRTAMMNIILEDTGAESVYILESADKKTTSKTNLKSLLNDIYIVSESFDNDKVQNAFKEQIKNKRTIKENPFIKIVQRFMKTRAGMGFAISSAIGLSVQPINMYLTKLKTGQDGFVGVEGRSKDDSNSFKVLKTLSSAAFFSMILSTLDMKPWKFTPGKFMDKMAFSGKMPTINQLKGIYGITIISRIFSARDDDELREVLTKDTLGFLSWLVLGDIVNRIAAASLDNSVMNYKKGTENSWWGKKMFNASLKTRDEILVHSLAQNGVSSTKNENNKVIAKSFSEMMKDLNTSNKISTAAKQLTKKRLRVLNMAQISGYLFSGLVLGLGIPNLNIYITNTLDKKRKAEQAKFQAKV